LKLVRKIISITMISSMTFILIFSITFVIFIFMLNLKELSNQTIKVLSDWNALDRITNDVLYYRLDSISRLETIEISWQQATLELNESFNQLKNNNLIKLLPDDIADSIEEAWYLWLFSTEKLEQGQEIYSNILHGAKTKEIIFEIDKITFYEKLLYLKEEGGTYQEKHIYQSFLSHMYVLDVTSENFSILLNDINEKIPDEIDAYIYYMLLAVGFSLVLVILVSLLSARRLIQPIIRLAEAVRQMSDNNYPVHLPATLDIDENDELSILHNGFNRMAIRIHALYDESLNKEKEKRKAQIRALQYQINPHFLYNTLATLQMTAIVHGDREMADNIQSLSRLLRNTISKCDHFITVSEELDIMKDYINIIQIRYKNRLTFNSSLSDKITDLLIPSLILQPLLENAVLHGLSTKLNTKTESAILRIEGSIEQNQLILSVFDNGKGINTDRLDDLLSKETELPKHDTVHIGLKNINDRIGLFFGSEFGVEIQSVTGKFTRVRLCLPILTEEKDAETINS